MEILRAGIKYLATPRQEHGIFQWITAASNCCKFKPLFSADFPANWEVSAGF